MTNEYDEFAHTDSEWAQELEHGVEAYTDMLMEAAYWESEEDIPETLSGQPFCGCPTCFWREALVYLIPRIIKGYEEGKLVREE